MGWKKLSVSLSINKTSLSCQKGDITKATITVTGETDNQGGHYRAYCYEDTVIKDTLYLTNRVTVAPGSKYQEDHDFTLECDDDCHVAGPQDSSGEAEAEVYAHVEGTGGVEETTDEIVVTCAD